MERSESSKGVLVDMAGLVLARSIAMLPRSWALGLGATAGRVLCALVPSKRRRMVDNLGYAGDPEPRAGAWRAAANVGRTMTEMSWLLFQPIESIDACFEVRGLDVLRDAVADGRGVLMAGAHVGNWELAARAAALSGTPVSAIARILGTPRVERAIERFRTRCGVRTLLREAPGSSIAAYRTLRSGHVLACMMDRSSSGRRLSVPFMGVRTKMPLGPLVLARRAGARIVAISSRRRPDGIVEVQFDAVPPGPSDESIEALTHRVAAVLDSAVRAASDQWYWIYRRPARHKWPRPAAGQDDGVRSQGGAALPA